MKIKSKALEVLLNDIKLTDNKRCYIEKIVHEYHYDIKQIIKAKTIKNSFYYCNLIKDHFLKRLDTSSLIGEEKTFLINYIRTVIRQLKINKIIV